MSIIYVYQQLTLQDSPKCTQILIFGLKINHLAALAFYVPRSIIKYRALAAWCSGRRLRQQSHMLVGSNHGF
jgi:hypothetical protein